MSRTNAILLTLANLIMMSLGTVLTKWAMSDVPAFTMAWLPVAIGMGVLSLYTFGIRRERIPANLGRQVWIYLAIIGFINYFSSRVTQIISLERLPANTHTYLFNFIGFLTMGMSIFILKESPTVFQVLGAVTALFGLRIFFDQIPSATELVGVLFVAISITGIAYTNNIARKLAMLTNFSLSNNIITTLAILMGGSVMVLTGVATDWPPQVHGWQNWAIVFYAGIFMVGVGLTVWNQILRTLRSYEASILGASTVIWTSLLAIPILGETLDPNQMAGIGLMIVGLALVQVRVGTLAQVRAMIPKREKEHG
ncbi:MAG: DMT family transporter [Caldilineaceae bacterium]|nr:DMT family transporter [Caldilineaceae bacterium]MCB0141014.1 DMT family transporter [Caldilineaceae bacterium]